MTNSFARLSVATALWLGLIVMIAPGAGCRSANSARDGTANQPLPREIPANAFVAQWKAPLELGRGNAINHLYLRGDTLFVYTQANRVYALSAAGGQILWAATVADPRERLQPPLVIKDLTIIPTSATLELFQGGKKLRTIKLNFAVRSPASGDGDFIYIGLDSANGGRLAKLDITRSYGNTVWELLTRGGIAAAPVLFEKLVYAASEDGMVHAVTEERSAAWGLQNSAFSTGASIVADLKVDEFGVYVACGDSKLYCLDRSTGKIKWQYYGGSPLTATPAVTADSVYQAAPGAGVAAIDKTQGKFNRAARWVVPNTVQFLADDGTNIYLRRRDGSIIGVDKKTGQVQGRSNRSDLVHFVTNTKTPLIYCSASDGTVICARPVLKAGVVGEMVLNDMHQPLTLEQ
jgi:outer membrane protein assembly factor BamB